MKTAVLVGSGFTGLNRQTIPLVLEPAHKTSRVVTREARAGGSGQARKQRRVVVPFSGSEAADAPIQMPRPMVWAWLEAGFVAVLLSSAFTLILFSVAAIGNV